MMDTLTNFFDWLQNRDFALFISHSFWAFPWVQLIHYTGMSMWLASCALIDLRVMGLIKPDQAIGQFTRELLAFNWIALGIGILGGLLLFSANASTYFTNAAFDVKMPLVLIGILYHGFVQGKALKARDKFDMSGIFKTAAFVEILIWLAVVTAATRIPNQ